MRKPLTIEIHGTSDQNGGAELMAIATAERLRSFFPNVRVVVPPGFGVWNSRARHQLLTTWEFPGNGRSALVRAAFKVSSGVVRRSLGLVAPEEVDFVLDASGFAFSDQWGPHLAARLDRKMRDKPRKHAPLILLPQALGPFTNPEVASRSRSLFERAEFICARDEQSLSALAALGVPQEKRRLFPDFTLSVAPLECPFPANLERFCAVVPNMRMVDKTSDKGAYLAFLRQTLQSLKSLPIQPLIVLHTQDDDDLAAALQKEDPSLQVFSNPDPRCLKWVLSKAEFVVASRFHAIVSSLSLGIPCIGTGWSHKYQELYRDFDCSELLLPDVADLPRLTEVIGRLQHGATLEDIKSRIGNRSAELKKRGDAMWREVAAAISKATGHAMKES